MNILLDTHILLWWLDDSKLLSTHAKKIIASPKNALLVSAASAWEIAIKKKLGKLVVPDNLEEAMTATGFEVLSINFAHALLAGSLPNHHNDPFDRMLIAQAKLENLTIMTCDKYFNNYEIDLVLTNE